MAPNQLHHHKANVQYATVYGGAKLCLVGEVYKQVCRGDWLQTLALLLPQLPLSAGVLGVRHHV